MDDDMRNWGYYDHQAMGNSLGLQLTSGIGTERDTKNLLPNAAFLNRSIPSDHMPDCWMQPRDKLMHNFPFSHPSYPLLLENPMSMPCPIQIQLPLPQEPVKDERSLMIVEHTRENELNLKKKPNGRVGKTLKPRKPKKVLDEAGNGSDPRGRSARRNTDIVINGMDFDISVIPTPVCTCTGTPYQCYRWGIGGWQSACCTNNLSTYPLPMSEKRRGARIAGRKMSQGAFKKVLEKLVGEGYNLSHPIDLKGFWAKHGTNKFVTIR